MSDISEIWGRPRSAERTDLRGYVEKRAEKDPGFRDAFEDEWILQHLLDVLVVRRHDLGLSQQEVASHMGVKQPTVSEFENEATDPKFSTLQRYARAVRLRLTVGLRDDSVGRWAQSSYESRVEVGPTVPEAKEIMVSLVGSWAAPRTLVQVKERDAVK